MGLHSRYKRLEQSFFAWLIATAQQSTRVGTSKSYKRPTTVPKSLTSVSNIPQQDTTYDNRPVPQTASYADRLPTYDAVVKAARLIANDKHTVTVPAKVVEQLKEIIDLRERCLRSFRANTHQLDHKTREQNRRHEHPVGILWTVLYLLQDEPATVLSVPQPPSTTVKNHNQIQSTSNAFAALQLDPLAKIEIDDASECASEQKLNEICNASAKEMRNTFNDRVQEFEMARFCLLEDAKLMVDELFLRTCQVASQDDCEINLAVSVNLVVDRIRELEKDLQRQYKDWSELTETLHLRLRQQHVFVNHPILRTQGLTAKQLRHHFAFVIKNAHVRCEGRDEAERKQREEEIRAESAKYQDNLHLRPNGIHDDLSKYFDADLAETCLSEERFIANLLHNATKEVQNNLNGLGMDQATSTAFRLSNDISNSAYLLHDEGSHLVSVADALSLRLAFLSQAVLGHKCVPNKDCIDKPLKKLTHATWTTKVAVYSHVAHVRQITHGIHQLGQAGKQLISNLKVIETRSAEVLNSSKDLDLHHLRTPILYDAWKLCLAVPYTDIAAAMIDGTGVMSHMAQLWAMFKIHNIELDWPDLRFVLRVLGE